MGLEYGSAQRQPSLFSFGKVDGRCCADDGKTARRYKGFYEKSGWGELA